MYEQIFRKAGGTAGRTPWHQDLSYLAVEGGDLAALWICFEPTPAEQSLEFVRGSHRGTVYDGSRSIPRITQRLSTAEESCPACRISRRRDLVGTSFRSRSSRAT
jgi:ectoine hydroxylase-related dioxygenase (phytanoyl-CoA dioxygenase family)